MNRSAIEHRAVRVSLVTGLSTVISIAFQLVSVPICLRYWGKEKYGTWLVLYAACMLVRSLDTGFVSYVGNKLNYLYHQDQRILRQHLSSSMVGIVIIGAVQLTIGVTAVFFDRVSFALGVVSLPGENLRSGLALLILIATWALSGPFMGILSRLLIPAGLMYESAWFSMGYQISQFAGLILAATLQFDLLQTSVLFAFVQLSVHFITAMYIRMKLPQYYPWWRGSVARIGLLDLGNSMLLTISGLIQQGATNGVIVLVAALSGPAAVPVFTTVRTVANLWTNVTNVLTTPLLPEVVRYHAKGEGLKLASISMAYWVLVGSVVNLGVILTYPLIAPLYLRWTTHAMVLDKLLLCIFLSSVIVANAGGLISLYLNGINSLGVVLITSVARGILSLSAGSFLSPYFGLAGFGAGILIGETAALFVMGYYFLHHALPRQGVSLSVKSIAPVAVSSASVLAYLLCEGLGKSYSSNVYFVTLAGVVLSAFWGWEGLLPDVKNRLWRICGNEFAGSGAV